MQCDEGETLPGFVLLAAPSGWEEVYADDGAILVRRGSAFAAEVPPQAALGVAAGGECFP